MNPIEHLQLIKSNPNVYRFISDEDLADLLLQLVETKSLFKKAKVELKNGKDGYTPRAGIDYLSREEQEALLNKLVSAIPKPKDGAKGADGKDAVVTDEQVESIVESVYDALFPQLPIPLTAEDIRDRLELLVDDERLEISAIKGLKEELDKRKEGGTTAIIARRLDQIGDVQIAGVLDGQVLTYSEANRTWVAETPVAGSGGAWGDITGTLSAQTDLQSALDGKANSLGVDDNYVTDAEKTKLSNLSGTNTGDQDLSGYSLTSHNHTGVYEPADGTILKDADIGVTVAPALGADDNYVTDAEKTVIGNTSGTNTGDNATNTQYSGLATSKQDTLVSGTNIKTINSTSLLGSGDIVISGSGLTALQTASLISIRF